MKCGDCGHEINIVKLEHEGGIAQIGISRHHSVCWDYHPGECCCVCERHAALYSHPWENGLPISHVVGWICVGGVGRGDRSATMIGPHGYCCEFQYSGTETPEIAYQREVCRGEWKNPPKSALEIQQGVSEDVIGEEEG